MKWTLSGICYYLIWFFAVGTTACTTTRTHEISRDQLELLAQKQNTSDADSSGVVQSLEQKRLTITSSSDLYVDRVMMDDSLGHEASTKLKLAPFAFSIDGDVITPIPEQHSERLKSPFTLLPSDQFTINTSEFSAKHTWALGLTLAISSGLAWFFSVW
jgi:hypothetical protein